ncbi:hypothetical protein AB4Z50_25970 [Paenibacillus sp. 2TAB26]|uniref:hypothetical protein n=1 Tax=Paenibacillus sp. 2TAB26 TaxID=3233005 RepID=UPI003F9E22C0
MINEFYSVSQASLQAQKFCEENHGWRRICDIWDSENLYLTWEELPKKIRNYWIGKCGEYSAESAWREFGNSICKVPFGCVSGKGDFHPNYEMVNAPLGHNMMMIFKFDELQRISSVRSRHIMRQRGIKNRLS